MFLAFRVLAFVLVATLAGWLSYQAGFALMFFVALAIALAREAWWAAA